MMSTDAIAYGFSLFSLGVSIFVYLQIRKLRIAQEKRMNALLDRKRLSA